MPTQGQPRQLISLERREGGRDGSRRPRPTTWAGLDLSIRAVLGSDHRYDGNHTLTLGPLEILPSIVLGFAWPIGSASSAYRFRRHRENVHQKKGHVNDNSSHSALTNSAIR